MEICAWCLQPIEDEPSVEIKDGVFVHANVHIMGVVYGCAYEYREFWKEIEHVQHFRSDVRDGKKDHGSP